MDRTWMYKARRTDAYFRGEVDKFIQAVKKPCKNWEDIDDTLPMQNLQKSESIQQHNYN